MLLSMVDASRHQSHKRLFAGINIPVLLTTSGVRLPTDYLYSDMALGDVSTYTMDVLTKLFLMYDDNKGGAVSANSQLCTVCITSDI